MTTLLAMRLAALAALATVVALMIWDAAPAAQQPTPTGTSYIVGPPGDNVRVLP